jgi:hypothetical protein
MAVVALLVLVLMLTLYDPLLVESLQSSSRVELTALRDACAIIEALPNAIVDSTSAVCTRASPLELLITKFYESFSEGDRLHQLRMEWITLHYSQRS